MKQTIVVDIDDVLGNENHAMMRFINQRYGHTHTEADYDIVAPYWGYWEKVWGVDNDEGALRFTEFIKAKVAGDIPIEPLPQAIDVLTKLKVRYKLAIVSSRSADTLAITEQWLEKHFPKLFAGVHFVELWHTSEKVTKAQICKEIGASYLIDDNAEHCQFAQEAGVQALLFGDYGWNRAEKVPEGVVRVSDWLAVQEYFDAVGKV